MQDYVKYLAPLVVIGALSAGLWATLDRSLLKVSEVSVLAEGAEQVLFERIKKSLEPRLASFAGHYLWDVDLKKILTLAEEDLRVESVSVYRKLPNRIEVAVRPHRPVLSIYLSDGHIVPVAKDGSLLPKTGDYPNLPLLRGKRFETDGSLRMQAVELMDQLPVDGAITQAQVSEIHYDAKEGFHVILIGSGLMVRLGEEDFRQRALLAARVLHYLEVNSLNARSVDARFSRKVVVKLWRTPKNPSQEGAFWLSAPAKKCCQPA